MEDHMRAELCCAALEMALGRRGPVPGLIHHSDRGGQYAGGDYRKLIKKAKLTQSMSRKGQCLDNAPMESFFASLKKEMVHQRRFRTHAEAKAAIFEYIEVFYNVSVRSDRPACVIEWVIVSTIDSGHLEVSYGGDEGSEEAGLV
jgi:transposase InsO family protein